MGILVRQGTPARQVLPPKGAPRNEADALAQTLWHSTRWCHVLGLGRGADSLHAQVAYGISAQPPLTGFPGTTPHGIYVARHGTAPSWWGGGVLNFDLDYPLRAPPSVLASLLTRRLVDAYLELAFALGRDPLCLYQGPEVTRPSRIDGLLVDTRLATLLHAAERLPRGAIPGHAPVRFDLHLRGASQRVVKFVRPKPVAPAPREEHEQLLLVKRLLDPLQAGWRAALSAGDVDRAWAFWTRAAEETLLALACPDITPDSLPAGATLPLAPSHLPRGRGTDQLWIDQLLREVRLCPKQRRDTTGLLSCLVARIQAAQGPLRDVLRWLERPTRDGGAMPCRVQQAWLVLRRHLERLRALGREYESPELDGSHQRLATLALLHRLRTTLAGNVQATLRAEDKDRLHKWLSWLEEAWSSDQGEVYRWLKDESYARPVTFLSRPDGTATANLAEMDGLLHDIRPINCKYATDPEPDPAAFLR